MLIQKYIQYPEGYCSYSDGTNGCGQKVTLFHIERTFGEIGGQFSENYLQLEDYFKYKFHT